MNFTQTCLFELVLVYNFRKIGLVLGWVVFALLAYKVSKIQMDYVEYNPFNELGIDSVSKVGCKFPPPPIWCSCSDPICSKVQKVSFMNVYHFSINLLSGCKDVSCSSSEGRIY